MAAPAAHVFSQLQRWTSSPSEVNTPDALLLQRFIHQRDESAFAALVARHGAMVLRVCRRVLGDMQDAEDAFQATFLILARKAGTLKRPEALPGWLHGVARRVALKARTKSACRSTSDLSHWDTLPAAIADPLTQLSARELLAIVDEEVQRLPSAQRSAVVLCCLEGHTQEEAARILGWTPGSVKGRLERGRRRLQKRLLRRDIALSAALTIVAVSRGGAAPALLQKSAVCTALVASTDSQASALAESVLKGMFLSKLSAVTALVVSLALAASSVLALVHRDPTAEAPASEPPKPAEASVSTPRVDAFGDPLPAGAIARLGTVRFRQGEQIEFLSFTPDGKRLLSQGWDGVRVWDCATGKQLRHVVPDEEGNGGAIDLSPDGKLVAVPQGGPDKSLQLWGADSGRLIASLETKYAFQVRFAPDGRLLAVAANNPGGVELWDVAGRKKLRALQADPPQFVERLAFSADARRLLTTEREKRIRLWDVDTGRKLQDFPFDREPGVLSPDGKWVAIIEANHKREPSPGAAEWVARIGLWDATSGKRMRTLTRPTRVDTPFSSVAFSADGQRLFTGGPDQFLRVWDLATGKELRRLPFESGLPHVLALSRDGNTLAAVVYGGPAVRMVNLTDGKERTPFLGHQAYIRVAAFSPDGRTAVTYSAEGALLVWDATTGRLRRTLEADQTHIQSLQFAPDGRTLFSGGWGDGPLYAWDLLTGAGRRRIETDTPANRIERVMVSSDGKRVVRQDFDQTIRLFDAATGKQQSRFSISVPAKLLGLALTPDGRSLVTWANDRKVRLWDVTDGRPLHEYTLPLNKESIPPGETRVVSYYNAALSPDGRLLAVGSQHNHAWATDDQGKIVEGAKPEHFLMFLDLATGCIAGRFDKATTDASSLAFSPDSRMLAWGGYNDPTVHLLEVAGVRERRRFVGHRGFVFALTFSADGNVLLSGSSDTTALIWDLARRPNLRSAPSATEMEKLWKDLAGEDAALAHEAIVKLAAIPDATVPFLRQRLRPVPPVDEKHLARLIADLDSGEFATRRKAVTELEKLGDRAVPAYCRTLEGKPSIETRRRLEDLLEKAGPAWWDVSGERLRSLRVVEALELTGTTEAVAILESLASGAGGARLTEQATAAITRAKIKPR